ncbi:hypothetical protein MTBLM1_30307 [Rhodospirillaceae bacterium LM-1]|nr:hypothetical protein MTBLM1_30307 [Rhodospirillaceae bacterium LM-1]
MTQPNRALKKIQDSKLTMHYVRQRTVLALLSGIMHRLHVGPRLAAREIVAPWRLCRLWQLCNLRQLEPANAAAN